jgi:predicted exporter
MITGVAALLLAASPFDIFFLFAFFLHLALGCDSGFFLRARRSPVSRFLGL